MDSLPPTRITLSGLPSGPTVATLRSLPPYSPDFNPIESAFAKKAQARTRDELWDASIGALMRFSPQECVNYFNAQDMSQTERHLL
jgi:hypothetical protein